VNGDVFRTPPSLALLSALVGTGAQLITLSIVVVLLAIAGSLYVDRGAMLTVVLQQYALTFVVNGYASGRLFKRYVFFPVTLTEVGVAC
jgi:transmembrane 9 superfamily protein 3